jgi:4-hydroxy-tetrahydrodipicolinate reductase
MGNATAEAVVRAGLTLIPYSFTGASEAVAIGNVGISGIPVELISPEERQEAMDVAKERWPDMIIVDYTTPTAVNGALSNFLSQPGAWRAPDQVE